MGDESTFFPNFFQSLLHLIKPLSHISPLFSIRSNLQSCKRQRILLTIYWKLSMYVGFARFALEMKERCWALSHILISWLVSQQNKTWTQYLFKNIISISSFDNNMENLLSWKIKVNKKPGDNLLSKRTTYSSQIKLK